MKIRKCLIVTILAILGSGAARAQVVVVNSKAKISEIGKSDLHDIFIGASNRYKDGSRAVPVLLTGAVREKCLKELIGIGDMQFGREWRKLIFAGQATMPRAFDTEAALLDYVASAPGAIGLVGAMPERQDVKALTVK